MCTGCYQYEQGEEGEGKGFLPAAQWVRGEKQDGSLGWEDVPTGGSKDPGQLENNRGLEKPGGQGK